MFHYLFVLSKYSSEIDGVFFPFWSYINQMKMCPSSQVLFSLANKVIFLFSRIGIKFCCKKFVVSKHLQAYK